MNNVLLILSMIAIAIGILMGLIIVGLIYLRRRHQIVNSLISADDLAGCSGVVTLPFDSATVGKVRLKLKGSVLELGAKTDFPEGFHPGDIVFVVRTEGNKVWVVAEDSLRI
jgi:membrane protein implicated in regulation of membrane protease activity